MSTTAGSARADLAAMALLVAEEAATLVGSGYRSRPRADEKARADLVTEFDRASEELIVSRLRSLSPEIPVVAEEATWTAGELEAKSARRGLVWFVDPLDGTTNFVHGHPFWCVAIGLMEHDRPVAGAVVAPSIGVRWTGWVGDEGEGEARRNGERCAVSEIASLDRALIATGFPAARDVAPEDNFASFVAVKRKVQAVRRCGSAAMDLCLVADGTYDGYWERRLHAWDTVAAGAIVLAAGGRITSLSGGAPDYHVGHLVASNGRVHDGLVALVGSSG